MARRWVPGRGVLALAVATALATATAGCSGGVGPGSESLGGSVSRELDGDAASTATGSPTTAGPDEPTPTTPARPTADPDDGRDNGSDAEAGAAFAFVPWGPDDPPVPQRYSALAASATGRPACGDAASNALPGAFWELAVEVCDALAGTAPWPATTAVPAPPPAPNAYEACLDAELAAMLRRALQARAASSLPPVPRYASPGTLSPCQTTVFEARALTAADGYGADVVPAGSVAVRVMAGSADVTSSVTVGGLPAEVLAVEPASGAATLVVLVPAPAEATTAPLTVTTTRGVLSATVALPAAPPAVADPGDPADPGGAPTDPGDPADPTVDPTDGSATSGTDVPGASP